jgi:poly(A) polymerase
LGTPLINYNMWRWHRREGKPPIAEEGVQPSIRDVLLSARPSEILWRWAQTGLLAKILPDLHALRGVSQLPAHRDDAFVHTLKVVDAIESMPTRRWAALLHDIAKAPTFIETPDGRSRFFEHDRIGAEMVPEIMSQVGESPELAAEVARIVGLHMRPIAYNGEWTDAAVRRLYEEAVDGRGQVGWEDLMALTRADLRGYLPEPIDRGLWVLDQLEERVRRILETDRLAREAQATEPRSPLDGNELMELAGLNAKPGFPAQARENQPGPWVAELKDYLLDEVRSGRLDRDDKESARLLAEHWLSRAAGDEQ